MKALAIITIIMIINFILPTAYAHVLESSGSVGAVLHIDPEDDPIAGEQTGFFFEFKDKNGKFNLSNCDCVFSIAKYEKEIYSQPLSTQIGSSNLTSASIFYSFPKKGDYEVKVAGKPNQASVFQPFVLEFAVKVSRESNRQSLSSNKQSFSSNKQSSTGSHAGAVSTSSNKPLLWIGGAVVILLIIFLIMKKKRRLDKLS